MPSPIQAAGGSVEPSQYAPLTMDRYFTGLCTQRSPLRDAAVPYLYEKFYSAGRTDSLLDGLNMEVSAKLTLVRRPGQTVYNSQTFDAVNRFYAFRILVDGASQVRVIVDTATGIYDGTGPNTKTLLYQKVAGDGKACFQSVGNTLYMSTGARNLKWMQSTKAWAPGKTFNAGDWIVDPNNNIQLIQAQQTATVVQVAVTSNVASIGFTGPSPFKAGQVVTLTGLTEASFLNGQSLTVLGGTYINGFRAAFVHDDYAQTSDTGTATYGNAEGVTGQNAPNWKSAPGSFTTDGSLQWVCWGASVQNWGIASPAAAPTVTQASLPNNYPGWTASTTYSTQLALVDENGNVQVLTTGGTLGTTEPTWSTAFGAVTVDGSAKWTCNGSGQWVALTDYALGDFVAASYTYYVQIYVPSRDPSEEQGEYSGGYSGSNSVSGGYYEQQPVTVTELFRCTTAGVSGSTAPDWSSAPGIGSVVVDGSVQWVNLGSQVTWSSYGASAKLNVTQIIVDSNGYLQQLTQGGTSGSTAPTWSQTLSAVTTDGTVTWTNIGPYSAANTGAWQWVFSYKCSIDGSVSTASGKSISLMLGKGNMPVLQGKCSTDPQVDTIVVYRTDQGGGLLLYEDEFPQPAGSLWSYFDTSPDVDLNALIEAPLAGVNDPPPTGISWISYHLARLWVTVDNIVQWCTGPDTTIGNGFTSWSGGNQFGFPDGVTRTQPITVSNGGLLCFTTSDVMIVMGQGTSSSPFYTTTYAAGIGLLSPDAMDIIGSTIHLFTSSRKQASLDPSAGFTETGFPIGDQFKQLTTGSTAHVAPTTYDPTRVFVTWHEAESGDTALYVSDGYVGWFRYSPVSSPESGFLWSPRAAIEGGTSAVQSVETTPGIRSLLVGPRTSGPILLRDTSVNSDNGTVYTDTYVVVGSMQMAQSGQIAEIAHVALDSVRVGTAPTVGLLLGEIAETDEVPFDMLERTDPDPPNLPQSGTLFNDRFAALQNGVAPLCRHCQMLLQWSPEDVPSELLQHTIFGAVFQERVQGAA